MDINLLLEPRGSQSPDASYFGSRSRAASIASSFGSIDSGISHPPRAGMKRKRVMSISYSEFDNHANKNPFMRRSSQSPRSPSSPHSSFVQSWLTNGNLRYTSPGATPASESEAVGAHSRLPPIGPSMDSQPTLRRTASQPFHGENPPKKQSKWEVEEDNLLVELRGLGMKWEDIAKRLPGRSSISCRLRYQNYLEKRAVWNEEKKNKLARLYARFKDQMWQKISVEMGIPWRSAEAMHWQLGEQEMSARANAPVSYF